MPTFDPDLEGALRSLQRQIDQINTARPGPMSWGARDGGIRFYGADGSTVLFQANSGGASVVSRGSLTSMTGLFDGIRDKNDNQDNVLSDHREWLIGHNNQLTEHRGRLDGIDVVNTNQNNQLSNHRQWIIDARAVADAATIKNNNQDNVLADHRQWIINAAESAADAKTEARAAQSRADSAYSRASTGISNAATAQARADSAYSRAGTGISDAAAAASAASSARARADAAYSLAATRAAASTVSDLNEYVRLQIARLDGRIDAIGPR